MGLWVTSWELAFTKLMTLIGSSRDALSGVHGVMGLADGNDHDPSVLTGVFVIWSPLSDKFTL